MSRLVALYPRRWRDRYGDEFLALMADRPPALRDRLDIVRGALDARLDPQLHGPELVPDRAGFATLAGFGVLLAALTIAANGPLHFDEYGSYRDGGAAALPHALATCLLAFGLFRLLSRLPANAQLARAAGWIAIVAGPLWSVMPWMPLAALPFFLGTIGLAIGAAQAHVISRWLAAAIAGVLILPVVAYAATFVVPWYVMRQSGPNFGVIIASLGALYLLVGLRLLRGFARPIS
jgi:hypothetical protein